MKTLLSKTSLWLAPLALAAATAHGVPYATHLTNNSGTISFRLNAPANAVRVIYNSGASSTNLGARPKGLTVTNLGIVGTFSVEVSHGSGAGWLQGVTNQVSDDANILMRFVNQRGVAVNKNPASPFFGRVYVAVATAGTNAASGRAVGKGIYVLGPDQTDLLGQGTTNSTARTGGITFGATEGPHRLTVGNDDGRLYIADWTDTLGSLYVTDPDVSPGSGVDVLGGPTGSTFPVGATRSHGSINASYVTGSLATSDLTVYVIDEDLQEDKTTTTATVRNSIWRWDIGAGPLPATNVTPVLFNSVGPGTPSFNGIGGSAQLSDFTFGPSGVIYHTQRRADNASTAGIMVRPAGGGIQMWNSLSATRTLLNNPTAFDLFSESQAVEVSPDGRFMAVMKQNTNSITFFPLDPGNGIPDITNRILLAVTPTTGFGRDIAFDAAGNIYSVSSGQGLLRIYSPGGFTIATTGSDGTFSLVRPEISVSVTATQPLASEAGPTAAEFTFTRSGGESTNLTVAYTIGGTAANGVDYATLSGSIVIPSGTNAATLTVTPIDDSEPEFPETIIITLPGTSQYSPGSPASATAVIADNETPEISLTAVHTNMYERVATDYTTFQLARRGDTNASLSVNLAYSGTAVNGVDMSAPASVAVDAGVLTVNFQATPIDDALVEGTETFSVSVDGGTGYNVGSSSSASATIVDDDLGAETVLFSDDFETDTTSNWNIRWGAGDNVEDYHAVFNYDYSAKSIPAAPGASTTRGLIVTANKKDTTTATAAVNLYPVSQSFSGDYALRFHMYLEGVSGAATTEHVLFGINHSGTKTNWFNRTTSEPGITGPPGGDGVWFNVVADSSDFPGGGSYGIFSAPNDSTLASVLGERLSTTLVQVFKAPPYRFSGTPASFLGLSRQVWVDVEVRHVGGVITWKINNQDILQITNTTAYTSGNIMLGYNDAFSSIGAGTANTGPSIANVTLGGFVVFDNVRVISLAPPTITITHVQIVGSDVEIFFTAGTSDTTGSFTLQEAGLVNGTYSDVSATITGSAGSFKAVRAVGGLQQYYRIRRL